MTNAIQTHVQALLAQIAIYLAAGIFALAMKK